MFGEFEQSMNSTNERSDEKTTKYVQSLPWSPDRYNLVQCPRHALPQLVLGPQRYMEKHIVLLFGKCAVFIDFSSGGTFGPGFGRKAVDDAEGKVVGGFSR